MRKPIITVLGSLNMDLVTVTERVPTQGETLTGQSFSTFPGGKGANQAVAAARLGADVFMVGKVGNDTFGKQLKELLRKEGIQEGKVEITEGKETGIASITISGNDNRIIVVPGANHEVTPEWVMRHEAQIKESDLLLLQLEIPIESVMKAAEIAHQHKIPIVLNPAPYQKLSLRLIEMVSFLTPNEGEFKQLLSESGTEEEQELLAAKSIITKGEEGVEYLEDRQKITIPAFPVQAVDTTGAGDTFNGAFAVSYAKTKHVKESLTYANLAAGLSVTKMGAQTGMPNAGEMDAAMRKAEGQRD
ncbi:ribokinase [Cytobacillus sp. NCCP-133]|uniref:ribokinase n=1 Tax=Cytobacillus sp. NCCP-133 TaxID=766848 RepID=UPI002231A931|nr:ribokinase [Cytobacillus sp. NCCP-133]GLB60124.1 ribokinase [Cytobacillus sp. NCCP-133]